MREKLTEFSMRIQTISPMWRNWRMRKYWHNQKRAALDKSFRLKKEQLSALREFWGRYSTFNDVFHKFYTQKTGEFNLYYLPDDIYSINIDRYYNDELLAKYLDDKSLYRSILVDLQGIVKYPETLAYISGGYFLNPNFELISEKEVISKIVDAREVFVKASIDSYGGHGVQYINSSRDSMQEICKKLRMGGG